ncbi:hypothetical protein [Stenotrophomonas sp. GD03657]|uniref:hypothetical protein n=1 Tax=Stenotrophomonas sp. GD03657 TaxID=2975363 RepID=UPI002449F2DC|nr:hypothetical protein [Stenotrophomonas sp. GD03657]MDH2154080.1 hypothetical protein [Stenotrophomonas sp. GD03657]
MTKIVMVKGETWLETYMRTRYNESPHATSRKTFSADDEAEDCEGDFCTGPEFEFDE